MKKKSIRKQFYMDYNMSEMLNKYSNFTGLRESAIIYRFLIEGFSKINFNNHQLEIIKKNNLKYDEEKNRIKDMGRMYMVLNSHKKINDFIVKYYLTVRGDIPFRLIQKFINGEVKRILRNLETDEIEGNQELIDVWVMCLKSEEQCQKYCLEVIDKWVKSNDNTFFKRKN